MKGSKFNNTLTSCIYLTIVSIIHWSITLDQKRNKLITQEQGDISIPKRKDQGFAAK